MAEGRLSGLPMVLLLAALAAGLLVLVTLRPAEAAFPGEAGRIFFDSSRSGFAEIYAMNPDGTKVGRLVGVNNRNPERNPAVSPDGSRIAYEYARGIWVMNANGTAPRMLTDGTPEDLDPAWSPDGVRIVFSRRLGGDNEIFTMNADGTGLRRLTFTPEVQEREPAWSPGGGRIAYRVSPAGGGAGIYAMNPDGTNQTNLTPEARVDCPRGGGYTHDVISVHPTWSPDGSRIAFAGAAGCGADGTGLNGRNIWLMNPDGSGKLRLTDDNNTNDTQPVFSPDGLKVAFSSDRDRSSYEIYTMNAADGSGIERRTTDSTPDSNPDWQPTPRCTRTVSAANDPLVGTAGKDVLCGDNRNNTLNGAGGNDIILGRGGNDRLIGGPGNDILNGGPGSADTASFPGSLPVRANLTTGFATGVGSDVLLGIENLAGSRAGDRLVGSGAANTLSGLGGNDVLNVRDGRAGDRVDGGAGKDTCARDAGDTAKNCP